jgi:HPt (histidine-containing phosphotransfer) domain-containing protein
MREALPQQDTESLYQGAHSLKGSSSNLGAGTIERLCNELEQQARAGALGRAHLFVKQLEAEFARMKVGLSAEVQMLRTHT